MKMRLFLIGLAATALMVVVACSSSDDGGTPTDTGGLPEDYDGVFADLQFNDFGADARQVLPPRYTRILKTVVEDIWRDGDYPLLGKVFSSDEPMSIHRNLDDHEMMMTELGYMIDHVAEYEAHHDTLPDEPFTFEDEQYGTGTMTVNFIQPTAPIAVPDVCQTVFGCSQVTVENVLQVSVAFTGGETYASPYFGFTVGGDVETLYYWTIGRAEDGSPEGTQLFLAVKDTGQETFEIAGSYFKEDGPGDEDRCNWVYHMTGNSDEEFTYNMGWYSECPEFQLFGCVQGSGDRDQEFGLRYHEYNDTTGWIDFFEDSVSEEIFGPVGGDPYASIPPENRMRGLDDYIDPGVMYLVDDSPLEDIPNPFAGLF